MDDRRKQPRIHLAFFTRMFDRQTGELLGYLANLTNEGAMLICDLPLQVGKVHRLYMDLSEVDFGKSHLEFGGECLWCRPEEIDPNTYNAGFRLTDLDDVDIAIIQRILSEFSLRS